MSIDWQVFAALRDVPPAVTAIRELATNSAHKPVISELYRIEHSLKHFARVGDWLLEAKEYHERITQIDHACEMLRNEISKPQVDGVFDPSACDVVELRIRWSAIRGTMLSSLLEFLQNITYLDEQRLSVSADGSEINGPEVAVIFTRMTSEIDNAFDKYVDTNAVKRHMYDRVGSFVDYIGNQSIRIEREITGVLVRLSNTLIQLRDELEAGVTRER